MCVQDLLPLYNISTQLQSLSRCLQLEVAHEAGTSVFCKVVFVKPISPSIRGHLIGHIKKDRNRESTCTEMSRDASLFILGLGDGVQLQLMRLLLGLQSTCGCPGLPIAA